MVERDGVWRAQAEVQALLLDDIALVGVAAEPFVEIGLRVKAQLDKRKYPTGVVTTKAEMKALSLHPQDFHGEWNYELRPR